MKPIIRWTLWERRWSIFWWSALLAAFMSLNLSLYPSFKSQAAQLNQLISHFPATARAFISGSGTLTSAADFLNDRLFYLLFPMLLSILMIGLGGRLIAKEEEDGTIELLLSRPLSRGRMLAGKSLAGLVILAIVGTVSLLVTLVVCLLVKIDVSLWRLSEAFGLAMLLSLLFGAFAFFLTCLGRAARTAAIGATVLVALSGYIINSLSQTVGWLRWLAKALPYHYYGPGQILHGTYNWWNATGFGCLIAILAILSWLNFRRRDIG